ncbi:hypothetical protein LguiA_019983 [Lonicera macranthoides]
MRKTHNKWNASSTTVKESLLFGALRIPVSMSKNTVIVTRVKLAAAAMHCKRGLVEVRESRLGFPVTSGVERLVNDDAVAQCDSIGPVTIELVHRVSELGFNSSRGWWEAEALGALEGGSDSVSQCLYDGISLAISRSRFSTD